MPPTRGAGQFAYVETFTYPETGDTGYVIHCKLCKADGRKWSTRRATKRALGREGRGYRDRVDMLDLWSLHMKIHHPADPQPDWEISSDLDPMFADAEARTFEITAEQALLNKIFGTDLGAPQKKTTEQIDLDILRKRGKWRGHVVSLPARKLRGVSSASQGWVCSCGASGHAVPHWDAAAQRKQGDEHLRDTVGDA